MSGYPDGTEVQVLVDRGGDGRFAGRWGVVCRDAETEALFPQPCVLVSFGHGTVIAVDPADVRAEGERDGDAPDYDNSPPLDTVLDSIAYREAHPDQF